MLRKLLSVGPRGWWDLWVAQLHLLGALVVVRVRPMGRLVTPSPERGTPPVPSPLEVPEELGRVERAIRRAAAHGMIRPRCLVRSIALRRMLESRGVQGSLVRFGVRRRGARFEAHAWVEWGGRVIGDEPRHVATFSPIEDLDLVDASLLGPR